MELPYDKLRRAVDDVKEGTLNVSVWSMLGWQEVRQRYRRSTLGPFWLTLSTGALILGMGPLYGRLFNQPLAGYFPYLAVGIVVWQLISSILTDSTQVFIGAEQYVKQIKLPLTTYVLRMVWRNAIIFAHNFLIVLLVLLFFIPSWNWWSPIAIAGVAAILVNGVWVGLILGMVCARFRDITQIVASVIQIAFFLTPVMWRVETLGKHRWIAELNPLYHMLEVIRGPLLGNVPTLRSWMAVLVVTLIGFSLTLLMFSRYRARVAYWV